MVTSRDPFWNPSASSEVTIAIYEEANADNIAAIYHDLLPVYGVAATRTSLSATRHPSARREHTRLESHYNCTHAHQRWQMFDARTTYFTR
jgi:hypothetical protein